ncbi:unnamed protein product [Ilex paraguariensis]|uniref:pectinesterase n=1 Tax=Ilex paraguariensis TaxID=185542 RepID=A0ABC8TIC5_9AQUA
MVMSVSFSFSKAIDCKLNQNDAAKVANTITVDKSGHGNFMTIQEAVDHIPLNNDQWIRIHANPGIYTEKVTIPEDKPCILLEGSGYSQTTITWNDHSRTDTSATFTVSPDNFVAKGIAFKNSYNRPVQQTAEAENAWTQALAVRIYGDKSAFHQCAFMGFQDTIWDVKGRHYFNSCYIEGAVDFIWGSGQSLYEDCSINSTAGRLAPLSSEGFITAQGRQSPDDPSGFVFSGGSISGTGKTYLGRAYGPYSRVIFHGTTLGAVVVPQGWNAWKFQGQE